MFRHSDMQEHLHAIFDAIPDGVTVQDSSGQIIFHNKAAITIMGIAEADTADFDAKKLFENFEIFDQDDKPFAFDQLPGNLVLAGKPCSDVIVKWKNKLNDTERWSEVKACGIKNVENEIKYIVNIFRDITRQKAIELAYEQTNRKTEHILESITDGFFALDENWRFTYMNRQAEPFFLGRKKEDLLGKNMIEEFPGVEKSHTFAQLSQALAQHRVIRSEEFFPASQRWMEFNAYPTREGMAVYLRDITEQKNIDHQNKYHSLVLSQASDAIISTNSDFVIQSWNSGAERVYGWSEEEAIGKKITDLLPVDSGGLLSHAHELKTKGFWSGELHHKRKDNRNLYVYASATLINLPSGEYGYMSINRDISERKRIQEELSLAKLEAESNAAKFEAIFQSVTDGIAVFDQNGNAILINDAEAKITGFASAEEMKRSVADFAKIFELFYPMGGIIPMEEWPVSKILRGESVVNWELKGRRLDTGREWYFSFSGEPVFDADGTQIMAVTITRDITMQKMAVANDARLAAIVQASDDAIIGKALDGTITSWNQGAARIYGYTEAEAIGKNISMLFVDGDQENRKIMDKIRNGESVQHYSTKRLRKDGTVIPIFVTVSPLRDDSGKIIGAASVGRDISQQKEAEEAIRQSEERFRALIENASDGIVLLDQEGNIKYITPAVQRILGHSETELIGANNFKLVHPDDLPLLSDIFLDVSSAAKRAVTLQYRVLHKDGGYRWVEGVISNLMDHENIQAIVINFRDISGRKKAEETLEYQYHHDILTDLPNRTYLSEQLTEALSEADRQHHASCLMLIDLDRFKQINESLGHAIGDRLIQEVALRIRSLVKDDHILTRLGGDEFGILLPKIETEEDPAKLATKILEDFRPPFYLDKHELYISPSIGISMYPYDGREPATLFKNAEAALYRAKEYGRNTYQFYTTTMNSAAYERLTMESKLRHAIENNEFVLFYQPQVDVQTGKIVGTEELIRWQRQDMTLILPDRFIPLAEANGLIEPMGEWILKEALRQAKVWHDQGHKLIMAINLSARQFKQKNFEQMLLNLIEESKLEPRYIELELTETVLAENAEKIMHIMNALRDRGVRFCLDDFSTGYSSLRYIKQFPVDMLKIERTFLKGIPLDLQNSAIAKSIITLGKSLNMEVTAEGVESKKQLEFLREHMCNRAQGYLFNGGMPAHSLSEILGEDRYISVVSSLDRTNPF